MTLKIAFSFVLALGLSTAVFAMDNMVSSEPQFLEMMTKHHQEGIEMAKMAQEKADSKDIKEMSRKIIAEQTKDVAKLQMWKKKWYPKTDVISEMPKMAMSKLESSSGKEFDKVFLAMMEKHHEGGIAMAKGAESKLQHKEVKSFAEETIRKQTAEVSKMDQIKSSIQ